MTVTSPDLATHAVAFELRTANLIARAALATETERREILDDVDKRLGR